MASKYQLKKFKKKNEAKKASSGRICLDCGFRLRGNGHKSGEHHRVMKLNRRRVDKDGNPQEHIFGI